MKPQQKEIREKQRESWNKFSPGWKKWDDFTMDFLQPMGNEIINYLQIKDGELILDIAAGTGEPGLTIARMTPTGKVVAADLAQDMLAIARFNAENKGIINYETVVADVCELPFADNAFDAISCRMGFMFFPDMDMAANEMHRVLKPGGRISTAVWSGPELNPWITTIMSVIHKHIILPPPPSGAPGMFRCSQPGMIADLFKQAGFKNIKEKEITGKVAFQSFDRYWEIMLDIGAPIVAALSGADDATIETIRAEVAELFKSRSKDTDASLEYASIIVYAEK